MRFDVRPLGRRARPAPRPLSLARNKHGGDAFDARDEQALQVFAASIGVILETGNEASKAQGERAK